MILNREFKFKNYFRETKTFDLPERARDSCGLITNHRFLEKWPLGQERISVAVNVVLKGSSVALNVAQNLHLKQVWPFLNAVRYT
ncbi:MAG: hypothetical protein AB2989_05320 [Candidatus Symbiodolus clandestinus]